MMFEKNRFIVFSQNWIIKNACNQVSLTCATVMVNKTHPEKPQLVPNWPRCSHTPQLPVLGFDPDIKLQNDVQKKKEPVRKQGEGNNRPTHFWTDE